MADNGMLPQLKIKVGTGETAKTAPRDNISESTQIAPSSMRAILGSFTAIGPRPAFDQRRSSGIKRAETFIIDKLKKYGFSMTGGQSKPRVEVQKFRIWTSGNGEYSPLIDLFSTAGPVDSTKFDLNIGHPTVDASNIIVTIPGKKEPGKTIIVCAHYDSRGQGADDNGSGVAALLETARALATSRSGYTVKIIFFTGEELNDKGSQYYIEKEKSKNPNFAKNIVCVIAVDTIGKDRTGDNDLNVQISDGYFSNDMERAFISAFKGNISAKISDHKGDGSDEDSFISEGIPSMLISEDTIGETNAFNKNMHTGNDTCRDIDFRFLAGATRGLISGILKLAR